VNYEHTSSLREKVESGYSVGLYPVFDYNDFKELILTLAVIWQVNQAGNETNPASSATLRSTPHQFSSFQRFATEARLRMT